jgi:hypothetical protein
MSQLIERPAPAEERAMLTNEDVVERLAQVLALFATSFAAYAPPAYSRLPLCVEVAREDDYAPALRVVIQQKRPPRRDQYAIEVNTAQGEEIKWTFRHGTPHEDKIARLVARVLIELEYNKLTGVDVWDM